MMYYLTHEDWGRTKQLCEQDWCGEVVKTVPNRFDSLEEAKTWCNKLNRRYMSRAPWRIVEY